MINLLEEGGAVGIEVGVAVGKEVGAI